MLRQKQELDESTRQARPFKLLSGRLDRLWYYRLWLAGGLLCLVWAIVTGWPPPITAVDINQHRLNTALPAPRGDLTIEQTFIPGRDGLFEIELLLVRYDNLTDDGDGRFNLTLLDEQKRVVVRRELYTATSTHNQTYKLRFPPQPHSAGQSYTLQLSGNSHNPVSAWGYDLDVYDHGQLQLTSSEAPSITTPARDLRFTTRYRLSWPVGLALLAEIIGQNGRLLLLTLLFVPLPGCLLLLAARRGSREWDPAAWWGAALAVGAATWPLLWSWLTLFGGRLTGPLLWGFLLGGWGTVLGLFLWRRRHRRNQPASIATSAYHPVHALLLLILLLGLSGRLLAVRDQAAPPWVDASRHALITTITANEGQILRDYLPYWSADELPYHYGFHTLSAGLYLISGAPLPDLLLVMGQLLNSLVPLAVYAAAWFLTRRRHVALLAAFLVALPFFFPAYYATWGRLTQLTGMLILPLLLAFTWRLALGARGWQRYWWLISLLAAGLFLIHFRVFAIYLPFAALVTLGGRGRHWRPLAAAGGLAALLVAPRLAQLLQKTDPVAIVQGSIPNYNSFPFGYLTVGWERPFLYLAAVCLLICLGGFLGRRRWSMLPMTLAVWVGSLFLLLSGDRLGLPETYLINLNSMYITLFLPLALLLAVTAVQLGRWLKKVPWPMAAAGYLIAGAAIAGAGLMGMQQQITILNNETILLHEQDLAGLEWLDENLPPDARVAVNSWLWLGTTYAGRDGGAWLVPLTGRESTTPPVDYIYNRELIFAVAAFNEAALAIDDWSTPEAAALLDQYNVSYIFVGTRGGFFEPSQLARNPALQLRYGRDGVFVFAVDGG